MQVINLQISCGRKDLCVPKFLDSLGTNFFAHHCLHYKAVVYSHTNIKQDQSEEEPAHSWPSQLFQGRRFAAFHLEINVRDEYTKRDYKKAIIPLDNSRKPYYKIIGPKPSFYWLFRQEFLCNTPRLWLDFFYGVEDALYGDQRLIDECIRWLNLPLQDTTTTDGDVKTNGEEIKNFGDIESPGLLFSTRFANSERILHIGSEQSTLNMGQIIHLVKKLVTVSSFGSLL